MSLAAVLFVGHSLLVAINWADDDSSSGDIFATGEDYESCFPQLQSSDYENKIAGGSAKKDVRSYLNLIGVKFSNDVPDDFVKEEDVVLAKFPDQFGLNENAATVRYDGNKDGAVVNFRDSGVKVALDKLLDSFVGCVKISHDGFNSEADIKDAFSQQKLIVSTEYKNFREVLLNYLKTSANEVKDMDFQTIDKANEVVKLFGMTIDITNEACGITTESHRPTACVKNKDKSVIYVDKSYLNNLSEIDNHSISLQDTLKHELSHRVIQISCGNYGPSWNDIPNDDNSNYTDESIANNYAVNIFGSTEKLYELSIDSLEDQEKALTVDGDALDYIKHPKDDEVVKRITTGDCELLK
ncbi:hypothetical protein FACS1894125_6340 [Actinomycetota bacterium]|nr:hypothetical protein FACS1894125_6340 [Actinomycetota bacterium]